ncbi:MAG: helicase-exonuclease AddAB subunit AddA [Oscillospiraceae bacterium]|nr:helicase-exonuclease AddAB subunit AddA [Oscillospiraceae bacterium]
MAEPKLTPEQQQVVDNRGGTLLVSAAAGSGKTKVLVDRVMDQIIHEGRNIHEFLIITFTNAAAAELRAKIAKAIGKALSQDPDNRHLQRQNSLMPLAQISTVHAFCGSLIRQYGYLLEVPSDYAMLEDSERDPMLNRILGDLLEESYEKMTPGFRLLADTLGAGRTDSGLEDVIVTLFQKLEAQPYPTLWLHSQRTRFESMEDFESSSWVEILKKDAATKLKRLAQRYDWAISQMQGDEKLEKKYLPLYITQRQCLARMMDALNGPWDEIGVALQMDYPRVSVTKYEDKAKLEAIQAVKNDGKKLLEKLREQFLEPAGKLMEEQNAMEPAILALLELVEELEKRFSREKRRRNVLDFSDQEHLAIRLLTDGRGKPSAIAAEVRGRFCEIMVDEYQDSNRVQELIYTTISSAGDQNRFLVGDVKQSIYGFRQAEPEIFQEKYQRFQDAERVSDHSPRKLVLSKNFRSRPEILEAANHVFATVMSHEVSDLDYGPRERLYPGLDSYPDDRQTHVELAVLSLSKAENGRDDESTKYQREAKWVAARVSQVLKEQLPVRDGDGTRPCRPEDIAILFRSKDPMGLYIRELEALGIPVSADNGTSLFETPEARVLVNILRTIDNPHQDIPLLSVLCSPLFRFSNDQLAQIRNVSDAPRFYDAMEECNEEWCQDAVNTIKALRKEARTLSAELLVWKLLQEYGLLTAYSAMADGSTRQQNLLAIASLARKQASGRHLFLYQLIQALDRYMESGVQLEGQSGGGVVLTTMHKSKGLEYPIVFLCDLSRRFNFRELSNQILVDNDMGLGVKMVDPAKRLRRPGVGHNAIAVKKRHKLLAEEQRVLYVAMTRPKDYLFMTYATGEKSDFMTKMLPGVGCPADYWAAESASCLGDWVILSALGRIEAGALFAEAGRPGCSLTVSDYPWSIRYEVLAEDQELGGSRYIPAVETESQREILSPALLLKGLKWEYDHMEAALTPSKLTATQQKGRNLDSESAEDTVQTPRKITLQRPAFMQETTGLSPTEKGTANHLFLQYADFVHLTDTDGAISELDRLVDEEFLTEQQAQAVRPEAMVRLFRSPLGQRMLNCQELIREFKFSLLMEAENYYTGLDGEKVLLQGVVDAAILEPDGITVIDFKTDRVTEDSVLARAEHYRGQLTSYRKALERIFQRPVKEMILYFLSIGREVTL